MRSRALDGNATCYHHPELTMEGHIDAKRDTIASAGAKAPETMFPTSPDSGQILVRPLKERPALRRIRNIQERICQQLYRGRLGTLPLDL